VRDAAIAQAAPGLRPTDRPRAAGLQRPGNCPVRPKNCEEREC
jgi:hypothetical protein